MGAAHSSHSQCRWNNHELWHARSVTDYIHMRCALLTHGVAATLLVSYIRMSHELSHILRVTNYDISDESQTENSCATRSSHPRCRWHFARVTHTKESRTITYPTSHTLCHTIRVTSYTHMWMGAMRSSHSRCRSHPARATHTNESRGMIFYESRTMTYQIETCVDGCYAFFSLVVCRWHSARATHTNESQSRTYCSTSHELWHFRRVTNTSHKHLRQFPYLTTLLVLMHSVYSPLNTSVSSAKEPYVCKALL